jgi:hypothetical protein
MPPWDKGTIHLIYSLYKIRLFRIAIHYDYKQIKSMDNYIIQEYIREPYLIDGFKFGKILLNKFQIFLLFS